jgi:hypothetical protein
VSSASVFRVLVCVVAAMLLALTHRTLEEPILWQYTVHILAECEWIAYVPIGATKAADPDPAKGRHLGEGVE